MIFIAVNSNSYGWYDQSTRGKHAGDDWETHCCSDLEEWCPFYFLWYTYVQSQISSIMSSHCNGPSSLKLQLPVNQWRWTVICKMAVMRRECSLTWGFVVMEFRSVYRCKDLKYSPMHPPRVHGQQSSPKHLHQWQFHWKACRAIQGLSEWCPEQMSASSWKTGKPRVRCNVYQLLKWFGENNTIEFDTSFIGRLSF